MKTSRWTPLGRAGLVAGITAASMLGMAGPALAASGPVSSHPASGTPAFPSSGATEQMRQLVQCGGTMYGVGSFHTVTQGGTSITRDNAFSFSATAPYKVTSWNPDVNGKVNSIAFNGGNCSEAYIGGTFSSVHGTSVKDIAEVSTSTGAVSSSFGHTANGQVESLLAVRGHLLTGGYFTSVNGSSNRYFASLSPATGRDDGFLHLNISGNYTGPGTRVYNQQLSHGGTLDLVEGVFTSVGGQPRQQIFMLSVGGGSAALTGWTSPEFSQHCANSESFYIRAASWSPDDGTVYTASTGFKPASGPDHGLCDSAAAFPASQTSVSHKWINYTGCDSLYSTAADANTAYFGGHERWADNSHGCNAAGPGAVPAQGMVGLSPSTGAVVFNPTRGRGLGADDMLITSAGLWIASDNAFGANACAHIPGHAGVCFLPYG